MRLPELIRTRRPAKDFVAVLVGALAVGLLLGAVADGGVGTQTVTIDGTIGPHTNRTATKTAAAAPVVSTPAPSASSTHTVSDPPRSSSSSNWRAPLTAALKEGVQVAESYGGSAAAAAWVEGWSSPIVIGPDKPDRMWSISKPVAAIATLKADGDTASAGVMRAMTAAIQTSDNCGERAVVLTLQHQAGANAPGRFDDTLALAGVRPRGPLQILPWTEDGPDCLGLIRNWGVGGLYESAPGFGTYSWTLADAVRFAHALADGTDGAAGATVLRLMRLQKAYTLEPGSPANYTSRLDWPPSGGTFPAAWDPAYKGGWGGHGPRPGFPNGDFMSAQIVVLDVGGHRVALAARFWPDREPSSDDPGRTPAPPALHSLFDQVQQTLTGLEHEG